MNQDFSEQKSKSQLKREMHELQDLGIALLRLTSAQLADLSLTDNLITAIKDAPKHKAHEAKRRHWQFIGKLMQNQDVTFIKNYIDALNTKQHIVQANHHKLENMREDLLNDGNAALNRLLAVYPKADRSYLRKLIKQSKQEHAENQSPAASRKLFKYLRELDANNDI